MVTFNISQCQEPSLFISVISFLFCKIYLQNLEKNNNKLGIQTRTQHVNVVVMLYHELRTYETIIYIYFFELDLGCRLKYYVTV
jgi:hypothetical protein